MARLGKFTQTPTERKRYSVDYSPWLDLGETVASVVFAPEQVTAPPLVTDGVQASSDHLSVVFYVSGGLDGQVYRLLITATTSVGQIKEDFVTFSVSAP
jgi:hypothetical protein